MDPGVAWNRLVEWLGTLGMQTGPDKLLVTRSSVAGAGQGLVSTRRVQPNTPLLNIPRAALLNKKTVSELYERENRPLHRHIVRLSAFQAITLHLATHRPNHGVTSGCSFFGPYLDTLPKSFPEHPLHWFCSRTEEPLHDQLCRLLPARVIRALEKMHKKLIRDLDAVKQLSPRLVFDDLLWAWLNVNSRCLFYSLTAQRASEDNITLCPLLDYANHSFSAPDVNTARLRERGYPIPTFLSPPDLTLEQGEQVFLRYGSHPRCILFTEYGFVDRDAPIEVSVDDLIEELFESMEGSSERMELLEGYGYWGDWTLHATQASVNPSYRLLPPLRLLHLRLSDKPELERFEATISGYEETISPENEAKMRDTLAGICKGLMSRADDGLRALDEFAGDTDHKFGTVSFDLSQSLEFIRWLWEEEIDVAGRLLQHIQRGGEI